MLSPLTLIPLLTAFALIHALPQNSGFPTITRSDFFKDNRPTCANDNRLQDLPARSAPRVLIQPDCDTAINLICTAAVANNNTHATSIGATENTCEGRTFFTGDTRNWPTYGECVEGFQAVAEDCLWEKSAGFQYGVFLVRRFFTGEGDKGSWGPATNLNGYVLGPKGTWGVMPPGGMDARDPVFRSP